MAESQTSSMLDSQTPSMSDTDCRNELSDEQVNVEEIYVETQPDEFCSKTCPADLTLIIEDRPLLVNKSLLAHTSPVFDTMLSGDFIEKDKQTVILTGKKFNDFVEFMRCMSPRINKKVTLDNVFSVLPLAHEYQVKRLIAKCEKTLIKHLSETAETELYKLLKIATMYNLEDLTAKCIEKATERPLDEIEVAGRTHDFDTNMINTIKLRMFNNLTTRHKHIFVHITTSEAMYRFLGVQSKKLELITAFKNGKVLGAFKKLKIDTSFKGSIDMCINGFIYVMKIDKTNQSSEGYSRNMDYIHVTTKRASDQAPEVRCVCGMYMRNWMDRASDVYAEQSFLMKDSSDYTLKLPGKYRVSELSDKTAGYITEGGMIDIELYLFIVNK
ncbi:hypothetical protein ACF0H5_008068 [Mactra antiquata]